MFLTILLIFSGHQNTLTGRFNRSSSSIAYSHKSLSSQSHEYSINRINFLYIIFNRSEKCWWASVKAQHLQPWRRWARAGDHTGAPPVSKEEENEGAIQTRQNWTKDQNNLSRSDKSRFLLQHSDFSSKFGVNSINYRDPYSLVSRVQAVAGCVRVGRYFLGALWLSVV